jgi:hypothetical protein
MTLIQSVCRIRPRVAPVDEGRMPIFAVLLFAAIVSSTSLIPVSGVAQELTGSPAKASSKFEDTAWKLIRNSEDPADFETYLEIYPNGRFNRLAKQRITRLTEPPRKSRTIVIAPTVSAPVPMPKPQLPATRPADSKLAASQPVTTTPKNPDVVLAPAAYVPMPAAPQPQLPAREPKEPKLGSGVTSQPVTEAEPVDPLDCAMGGMDVD